MKTLFIGLLLFLALRVTAFAVEVVKINEQTIQVTDKGTSTPTVKTYDYAFLLRQRKDIQEQKDRDDKQRDLELFEVNWLIAEAEKAGIKKSV